VSSIPGRPAGAASRLAATCIEYSGAVMQGPWK
jgi:hypothetical protein